MMPDENIFRLSYSGGQVDTTPANWDEMEMGISRELFTVKRELTSELSFFGPAATLITTARASNLPVTLSLYKRFNADWSMTLFRTWKGEINTYKRNGGTVSMKFAASTPRQEVEKNKSTAYEIPLPTTHVLNYTGIDHDTTNIVSGIVKKITSSSPLYHAPSNWILPGVLSTADATVGLTFNNFAFVATEAGTYTVKTTLGNLIIELPGLNAQFNASIVLAQYRGTLLLDKYTWMQTSWGFTGNGQDEFAAFNYPAAVTKSFIMQTGDVIRLMYNTSKSPSWIKEGSSSDLRLEVTSYETSTLVDYPIFTITPEALLTALLAKMCVVPPALTYSLTHTTYVPVLSSAQGLTQTDNPTITVSFEDVMKFLLCCYGADYEITDSVGGDDMTLTVAPASTFFADTQATTITECLGIETATDEGLIYGSVVAGFESDDDAKNGTFDPLCKNTFKLGNTDAELDLVCPFKGTPTTIESFIVSKKGESSTTKESDTSVFVFAVNPFVLGETTLYKSQTFIVTPNSRIVNSHYFNVPFSPMRMLIANAAYLKVSKWNDTTPITFVSTDRSSLLVSLTGTETTAVTEYNGTSAALLIGMATPLYLPVRLEMECLMDLWTLAQINEWPRQYFTAIDEKNGLTHNFRLNDVTLPLTKRSTVTFNGLLK